MTNKSKKNFLRSFLATTSAFAVIAGASNSAMGAQYTTDGAGNPRIADGYSTTHSNDGGVIWAVHDSFSFDHAKNLSLGRIAGANRTRATVATLDLNGKDGVNIKVKVSSSIASLVDSAAPGEGAVRQTATLIVKDNQTLALGGEGGLLADGVTVQAAGDFSALGDVTLGSAGVGTLQIDADNAKLDGTIDSKVANNGVITVNAANVTFNGVIGGVAALGQVIIAAGKSATFTNNVSVNNADGILLNGANAAVTLKNNAIVTGTIDAVNAAGTTLKFAGAGTVTQAIGANNALTLVEASGNGVVALHSGESRAATFKTSNAGAIIEVAAGGVGKLDGKVDATVAGGTLRFLGTGQVTGTIGETNPLTLVEASGLGVVLLDSKIETARLDVKNGATVKAADNSAAAIAAINLGTVGGGTLEIDAGGGDYDLLNGTAINFKHDDSVLKLTNTTNAGNSEVTLQGNLVPGGGNDLTGKLEIHSNGTKTLDVDINAGETIGTDNTHRLNEVIVSGNQNTTITPDIFAKTITVSSTAEVIFDGAIDSGANSAINFTAAGNTVLFANVTAMTLAFADNARIVTVADGKTLTVNTITSGAGNGSRLVLAGDTDIVLGGAQAVAVDLITAAANGNTVNLGAGVYTVPDIQLIHANGELELADGFELTGGMNVAAGNAATVTFLGDGKVIGALGGAGGGAGGAVGVVTVAGNSTLELGGNVNATSLDGKALNAQNLKFINAGNITVACPVGGAAVFDQIEFKGGGRVTFGANDLIAGQELNFTANTEVVTDGYDLAATNITNANNIIGSKLTVKVAQAITGNVGTLAQPFGTLHMDNAAATNVSINTAGFFAGVTGNAKVSFDHAGGTVNFLGSGANSIKNANFVQDGRVFGEVHAGTIDVQAGRTATFNGTVFEGVGVNNSMTMHANDAQADFDAKVVLNMPILANANGNGVIFFNDGAVLNRNIGTAAVGGVAAIRVATVGIGGDSTINANIYSNAINVGGHEVTLIDDKTFDGVTAFNGTTITLGKNDLTMTNGNVTFTGASKINTTVTAAGGAPLNLGNLVAGAGSTITLQGAANTLEVSVGDKTVPPINGKTLTLIATNGDGALDIKLSQITIKTDGAFTDWTHSIDGNQLVLTQRDQTQEVLDKDIAKSGLTNDFSPGIAQAIENAEPGSEGEKVKLQLHQMSTGTTRTDALYRTTHSTSNEVSAVNLGMLKDVTSAISGRMASVAPIPTTFSAPAAPTGGGTSTRGIKVSSGNRYIAGVASGDDHARFGAWATPFYSKATQKKRSGTSGFKTDSYGGTFGVDTKANDNMVIGLAFSAMNTDIKHKDLKSGDKTKVTSFLVSAYATHQFTNNWFGQSVFSMGSSSVNNKENRRISDTQFTIAEGKYSSMTFAAEILGGYNHALNNQFVITPMLGLNYNRINDGSYNESSGSADTPLMEITKKASHKLDVVGGIRLTAMPFMVNGVEITPEAHAFVRHDVIGKGAKVNAKIPGLNLPSEKAKLQKTFYNVGASLNAAYGAMDYGVSADANFANKYVGVQGAVKVRVNF